MNFYKNVINQEVCDLLEEGYMTNKTYNYHELKDMIVATKYKTFDSIAENIDVRVLSVNNHSLVDFMLCSPKYLPFLVSLVEKKLTY